MRQMAALTDAQHALLRDWLDTFISQGVSQRELARVMAVSVSKLNRFLTKQQDRFYVPIASLTALSQQYSKPLPDPIDRYVRAMTAGDTGLAYSPAASLAQACFTPPGQVALHTLTHGKASKDPVGSVQPMPWHDMSPQTAYLISTNREAHWLRAGWVLYVSDSDPLLPGADGVAPGADQELRVVRVGADEDPPAGGRPIIGVAMTRR